MGSTVPALKHEIAIEAVRSLRLFNQLDAPNLLAIAKVAELLRFSAHTPLLMEGEQPELLYVVLEGSVVLFARSDNREASMDVIRPTRALMPEAVVRNWPYLVSARTLEATRLITIPAETVRNIFVRDPAFARALACEIAESYGEILDKFRNQKLRTSIERLAWWVVKTDMYCGGSGEFSIPYDKRTLAFLLGMTPESLSRSIRTLMNYGVTVRGREVIMTDTHSLVRLAKLFPIVGDPSR